MFEEPALATSVAACLDWARTQWLVITLQVYIRKDCFITAGVD